MLICSLETALSSARSTIPKITVCIFFRCLLASQPRCLAQLHFWLSNSEVTTKSQVTSHTFQFKRWAKLFAWYIVSLVSQRRIRTAAEYDAHPLNEERKICYMSCINWNCQLLGFHIPAATASYLSWTVIWIRRETGNIPKEFYLITVLPQGFHWGQRHHGCKRRDYFDCFLLLTAPTCFAWLLVHVGASIPASPFQ